MTKLPRFRVVFEEEAGEYIFSLSKRRGRRLLEIVYTIANHPFETPDYVMADGDGRPVSHVLTEGYIISYWVDALRKRVVVVEIESAS